MNLSPAQVHLWVQSLDLSAGQLATCLDLLSPGERARAARFHFDRHRNHFIAARGRLREILSAYLDTPPNQIVFTYAEKGKPSVASPSLKFNLSHSGGLAVYAFTDTREIGVDIEEIRLDVANERIPEHFFSPAEVRTLRGLPEAMQGRGFFKYWTRKEAYIKARAEGLSIPLNSFDVSVSPVDGWTLRSFDLPPNHVGAVAAAGESDYAIIWR